MALPLSLVLALAQQCAPAVAPATLAAVARAESGFDPLAIGVNGPRPRRLRPGSSEEAAATARRLIAAGENIDLGIAQINARNLGRLGLTIEAAFEPCANLAASAKILAADYGLAASKAPDKQAALRAALSYYNTGTSGRGIANGYVDRVLAAAGDVDPSPAGPLAVAVPPQPPPPRWDVFAHDAAPLDRFVFSPQALGDQP